ncbi:hypothetical protein M422DRAFT_251321 [Sphaerobolus stellatus SS14]|uniref:Uncharacterized protein n=1 Tax=Sphaerobolus stellatus (strain SS14) TaxID=990650 RepID=A0A0C9UQC1_SPHS4|nr:hypothetical protein M422DRAFT_251321 [Sphaerobolus stellatus SS14]
MGRPPIIPGPPTRRLDRVNMFFSRRTGDFLACSDPARHLIDEELIDKSVNDVVKGVRAHRCNAMQGHAQALPRSEEDIIEMFNRAWSIVNLPWWLSSNRLGAFISAYLLIRNDAFGEIHRIQETDNLRESVLPQRTALDERIERILRFIYIHSVLSWGDRTLEKEAETEKKEDAVMRAGRRLMAQYITLR